MTTALYTIDSSSSLGELVSIDLETGLYTRVGSTGLPFVTAMAFDPSGTLYAVDANNDALTTVDLETGAATTIGSLGSANVQGLAVDSLGNLYGVDTTEDQLVLIDTTTAEITVIGDVGFASPSALVFDGSDTLYGVDTSTSQLITIDTTTGAGTAVGTGLGVFSVNGLAFDLSGTLYGVTTSRTFVTIDTTTGVATVVADQGFGSVAGMEFDASGTLYGLDTSQDVLLTIDLATGLGTEIGSVGFGNPSSLAVDASGTFYGVDTNTDALITIDPLTGAGTAIGSGLGFSDVRGLAFDAAGTLYGVDRGTSQLIIINTATGVGTGFSSDLGFIDVQSLAFDASGTLYGVDLNTDQLITIDTTFGIGTAIGDTGFETIQGLTFDASGTLYGYDTSANAVVTIDTSTGEATRGAMTGIDTPFAFAASPIPVNEDPVAVDDTATTDEGTPVTITAATLLANDTDADGDTPVLSAVLDAVNGSVELNSDGDVVFTPDAGFSGEAGFTYTISDGNGGTDTGAVAITVNEATDPTVYFSGDYDYYTDGVFFTPADILEFDGEGLSVLFDGSDVGVWSKIDALDVIDDSTILMSFAWKTYLHGVGFVDDSDIVQFNATSLGSHTSGSFEMYLDGSDIGLTRFGEDIDALTLRDDGSLLISTKGNAAFSNGTTGADEDVFVFTPTSIGTQTSGDVSIYIDGSDVGLNSSGHDVDALAVDSDGLIISTSTSFDLTQISGRDEDAFAFAPSNTGPDSAGAFAESLVFDGSAIGFTGELNGIDIV